MGAYTDILSEFGGDSFENTDRFLTTRTSGVATLRTKNLFGAVDGLNVGAQYQGEDDTNSDPSKQHGNGYGFSWFMTTLRILAYLQLRPIPTVL